MVQPLYDILQRDDLQELHGPASLALTFCAYVPLTEVMLDQLPREEQTRLLDRNASLENLRLQFDNDATAGYRTDRSPQNEAAAEALVAWWQQHGADFQFGTSQRFAAIFTDTGFVHFFAQLFGGTLYSHERNEYVFSLIAERWYVSFWLQFASIFIAWGLPSRLAFGMLGVLAAWRSAVPRWGCFSCGRCRIFYR